MASQPNVPTTKCLGENVEFEIHAFDETNTVIRPDKIAKLIEAADRGLVMLVGVQSNQFPRALDIARPLRKKGIAVAIGGFHVSGTMSMLKDRDPSVQEALDMGISVFAGEAEGRLGQVLLDAFNGELKPVYNYMDDLPNIEGVATPVLPAERVHLTAGCDDEFRRRPRLSVCMFVLHDHQRPGPQIPPPFARRHRKDRPRQRQTGPAFVFYHRRQFCAE